MTGEPQWVEPLTRLGRCPHCQATIPDGYLLIRYESANGWPTMFAECPDCEAVVHPR